jgi:hypothetical protein
MKWENDNQEYVNGEALFIGKWKVGGVYYDGCHSKGDPLTYMVVCYLPGIKKRFNNYETSEEGKKMLETAVKYWIEKSGLKENE